MLLSLGLLQAVIRLMAVARKKSLAFMVVRLFIKRKGDEKIADALKDRYLRGKKTNMLTHQILELYLSNLNKLKEEISAFKNENDLWHIQSDVKNSPGNLALHLTGNIKHFIGAQLGNSGYVRNRDKEFSDKNIPREKILSGIDEAIEVLNATLSKFTDDVLQKDYPILFLNKQHTFGEILFILYGHLNYHLGQINYQRRLL